MDKLIRSALVLASCWISEVVRGQEEHAAPLQRADYLASLRQLETTEANVELKGTVQRHDYETHHRYWSLGSAFQSEIQYPGVRTGRLENTAWASVRNELDKSLFKLDRGSPGGAWYIAGLGESLDGDVVRFHRRYCKPLGLAATHLFDFSMREIAESNDIGWTSRMTAPHEVWGERIEVVVDLTSRQGYFHEARIRVAPQAHYAITDYELIHRPVENTPTATFSGIVKYRIAGDDQSLIPDHVEIRFSEGGGPSQLITNWQLDSFEFGKVSAEQFSLDHYGLGAQLAARSHRVPWLLIVNGILILAALASLRTWKRAHVSHGS